MMLTMPELRVAGTDLSGLAYVPCTKKVTRPKMFMQPDLGEQHSGLQLDTPPGACAQHLVLAVVR